MIISWDHPVAIELRKGIVKGLVEDMKLTESQLDSLQWAKEFMDRYERKQSKANQRREVLWDVSDRMA